MIARLSMIRGLRVISRTSVMRFKDTRTPVPEIAKTLGVDAMVEGSVIREGSRVRVHIQLIRGATDEHFWSETYDRELGDALALESEVAQAIAGRVEATVTGESQKFSTTQALLLYVEIVKARFLPSGEANGTPRIELVVHNSETWPFELTRKIVAPRTEELVTNHPFPSANQVIPERRSEPWKAIKREDPFFSSTTRMLSLCASRSTMAIVEPSGDRSQAGDPFGSASNLTSSLFLF
jgi:hypothetical protein